MTVFWNTLLLNFFISFGIMVGASVFASVAAIVSNHPPVKTMVTVAGSMKIWAVAAALGGTFESLEVLEQGLFRGEIRSIVKELIYIVAAFAGANAGFGFIMLVRRCHQLWTD